jgi:uncharacterized membrane protein SpoIIM required for sporulation
VSWFRLEAILAKMEKKGAKSLEAREALELPGLYQTAVSSLSLARNLILDRLLLQYLENLSFRAYIAVYGPRESLAEVLRRFFRRDFPKAAWELRFHALGAFVLFLAGFMSGFLLVNEDPNNFLDLFPPFSAPIHPNDSRQEVLDSEIFPPWPGIERTFIEFSNFLFRNNSKVAIYSFCLSFALGVPTAIVLFHNGRLLGAVISLHAQKDLTVEYLAWLSIHGVTEILAFLMAAGAGLSIAQAIVLPGPRTRREALSRAGGRAGAVMMGAVIMLAAAAVIEGVFRQLIDFTAGRAAFALFTALFWYWYFCVRGRSLE